MLNACCFKQTIKRSAWVVKCFALYASWEYITTTCTARQRQQKFFGFLRECDVSASTALGPGQPPLTQFKVDVGPASTQCFLSSSAGHEKEFEGSNCRLVLLILNRPGFPRRLGASGSDAAQTLQAAGLLRCGPAGPRWRPCQSPGVRPGWCRPWPESRGR